MKFSFAKFRGKASDRPQQKQEEDDEGQKQQQQPDVETDINDCPRSNTLVFCDIFETVSNAIEQQFQHQMRGHALSRQLYSDDRRRQRRQEEEEEEEDDGQEEEMNPRLLGVSANVGVAQHRAILIRANKFEELPTSGNGNGSSAAATAAATTNGNSLKKMPQASRLRTLCSEPFCAGFSFVDNHSSADVESRKKNDDDDDDKTSLSISFDDGNDADEQAFRDALTLSTIPSAFVSSYRAVVDSATRNLLPLPSSSSSSESKKKKKKKKKRNDADGQEDGFLSFSSSTSSSSFSLSNNDILRRDPLLEPLRALVQQQLQAGRSTTLSIVSLLPSNAWDHPEDPHSGDDDDEEEEERHWQEQLSDSEDDGGRKKKGKKESVADTKKTTSSSSSSSKSKMSTPTSSVAAMMHRLAHDETCRPEFSSKELRRQEAATRLPWFRDRRCGAGCSFFRSRETEAEGESEAAGGGTVMHISRETGEIVLDSDVGDLLQPKRGGGGKNSNSKKKGVIVPQEVMQQSLFRITRRRQPDSLDAIVAVGSREHYARLPFDNVRLAFPQLILDFLLQSTTVLPQSEILEQTFQ